MRDETPERGEVDDHSIIEVGVPERGDAPHLVEEGTELINEALLRGKRLALRGPWVLAKLASPRLKPAHLVLDLRGGEVVLDLVKRILGEGVEVEPY